MEMHIKVRFHYLRNLVMLQLASVLRRKQVALYSDELFNESINMLRRFFPAEEIPGYLAERFQALVARSVKVSEVEYKFVKNASQWRPKRLSEHQREFFDNYVSFLQCYYSFLSAIILFIKKSYSIRKNHIATGRSTKKFLESCKNNLSEVDFNILYQSTIIRSLISDHIQDGKLTWGTVNMSAFLVTTKGANDAKSKNSDYDYRYILILFPMFQDSYNEDLKQQLRALYFTPHPTPAYIAPHHADVVNSLKLLLKSLPRN